MAGASETVLPETVLAVVPTLNEAAHIETCLASLIEGDADMARVTVVVADGGSTDRTCEIVEGLRGRWPNLTLIDNPKRLQSAALNRAVATMAGQGHRVLVRCDAHSGYPPGFVMNVARALADTGAASVAVPMDAGGQGCFRRALACITDTKLGSGGSAHRGGQRSHWVDHGHHAGFDLDWYRRLGGYDESFSHNEDAEYDRRLTEAGGRIWLDAALRIGIVTRGTPAALWKQYWQYGRGRARTVLKHRMTPRLRQMVPVGHVGVLALSLALLPFYTFGLVYPVLYGALVLGASLWAMGRLASPCGLWAGVAVAVMHTAWGAGFLVQAGQGRGAVSETPPIPVAGPEAAT